MKSKDANHPYGELSVLSMKLHHDFYGTSTIDSKEQEKLEKLIEVCSSDENCEEAIVYFSSLALLNELQGDINGAIKCREKEIELIEKLHEISNDPNVLIGYEKEILQERRDLLGNLEKRSK